MNIKKYVEDEFLSSTLKLRYSTIKEENLVKNHKVFYEILLCFTQDLNLVSNIEKIYYMYNNITTQILCKNTGCMNITKFVAFKHGHLDTCSVKCSTAYSAKAVHQTKLNKNGYSDIVLKQQKTMLARYGAFKSDIILEQIKATNLRKYGGNAPLCSSIILEKVKATNLRKYGVENVFQAEEIKNKIKVDNLRKYGFENVSQTGLFESGYKWKDYILPSGKMLRIQGYENFLLDELLNVYNESDIITSRIDMPIFLYELDCKTKRYFPDAYIPSTNTIYEVKSEWTAKQNIEMNEKKFQAVKDAGFNFILKIFK